VQWAIARGETRTGVTIMRLDAGLDTGPMLLKWETEIGEEETAVDLSSRLATAGADLLVRGLAELPALHPEPQDDSQATYAAILKKEDGHINWSMSAREILNRIRGFQPWPGCYAFSRGRRLHVWKARNADCAVATGQLRARERRLYAGCADSAVELLEVQWEGKKRMEAAAFLNGFPIESDEALA
jgi:methionyl-tRNA formyltransferase